MLLCSMLIGADYRAYCVSGYASRELCECDQTQQDCPPQDDGRKVLTPPAPHRVSVAHRVLVVQDVTPEPQQNKYTAKPKKKLQSRYLLQQETRNEDREAALILEQQVIRRFSASGGIKVGHGLEMLQGWRREVFHRWWMWSSKVK